MRSNSGDSFIRQLSSRAGSDASSDCSAARMARMRMGSRRWRSARKKCAGNGWRRMDEDDAGAGARGAPVAATKRVMVVIDESAGAEEAMMWALTHVANKGDSLTLLQVLPRHVLAAGREHDAAALAKSLGSLCKACKPEVEVEALVIQGPKLATVLSQVKKLEASVLVLSQSKPSPFFYRCLCGSSEEDDFVEDCINKAECLALAVRKQSRGMGGFLVSTRWQKNFWLLA